MRKFVHDERKLQFSLVLAIALLFAVLVARAYVLNTRDRQLCGVLYTLVARSGATVGKPGSPGYSYYHDHPDELAKARSQNREFLNALPCNG